MSFHSQFVSTNQGPSLLLPGKGVFPPTVTSWLLGFLCMIVGSLPHNITCHEVSVFERNPTLQHVASLDRMICDNWTEPQSPQPHMTHSPACVCTLDISWLRSSIEACVAYNLSNPGSLTVSCDLSISNLYTVQVLGCFIDPAEEKKLDLCCSRPEGMNAMTLLRLEHRKLVFVCPLIHRKMLELSVPSWRIKKVKKAFPFTGKLKFLNFPLCAN